MPEVRDLSEALPETTNGPITGVGVVASRNRAPAGYEVVSQTTDGLDADLWKDGLFKSKVTRYLCFTRTFSKENVSRFSFVDTLRGSVVHLKAMSVCLIVL
uniref:MABP domain-containing protein n=1 Tax=Erpetoichthys calabaricus TaxID=27687 RepID=A0A8C4SAY4_ERPCA